MIKKSIEFNLIPDENKEYNVKMFHNETQVREENIDSPTMKHYLSGKFSDKELNQARLMILSFFLHNSFLEIIMEKQYDSISW